jgi:hypothetical protein
MLHAVPVEHKKSAARVIRCNFMPLNELVKIFIITIFHMFVRAGRLSVYKATMTYFSSVFKTKKAGRPTGGKAAL